MCCVHAKQTNKQKPIKKKGGAFLSSDTAVLIPGYFHPGAFYKILMPRSRPRSIKSEPLGPGYHQYFLNAPRVMLMCSRVQKPPPPGRRRPGHLFVFYLWYALVDLINMAIHC